MEERYYPNLTGLDETLRTDIETVRMHLMEDSGYLDSPDCPYPQWMCAFLKSLIGRGGTPSPANVGSGGSITDIELEDREEEDVESEIRQLLQDIRQFGRDMGPDADAKDKAAYFRVHTALLEKLVNLQEKAADIAAFSRLIQFIMRFAEDHMSPDLRTNFMDHLKQFGEAK